MYSSCMSPTFLLALLDFNPILNLILTESFFFHQETLSSLVHPDPIRGSHGGGHFDIVTGQYPHDKKSAVGPLPSTTGTHREVPL